jgi:glutamine synthetase
MKVKLEYIWLDGYTPEPNLRSKVKVIEYESSIGNPMSPISMTQNILEQAPEWNFDGSSTMQAEGKFSDCILKPIRVYTNPLGTGFSFLVFCEVLLPDRTPHPSNTRAKIQEEDENIWFGFEQEYVLRWVSREGKSPLGFENFSSNPEKQGKYYCSVGQPYNAGREISDEHLDACLSCGIGITGTNSEVMLGQWEYQVFGRGLKKSADDLWISRFLLLRIAERYKISVDFHPKPMGPLEDWNGSGLHTNFSTTEMREAGNKELFDIIFDTLKETHQEAINIYGSDNHLRLTGNHETQSIDVFTWGISDRGASIRIPLATTHEWKGYLEDRRPGSNGDPYKITEYLGRELKRATQKASGKI